MCNRCILNEIIRHALKSAVVKLVFQDFSLRNHRKRVMGLMMIENALRTLPQANQCRFPLQLLFHGKLRNNYHVSTLSSK